MPTDYSNTLLIQFAKSPSASNIKTRLAPVLDHQQRRELHMSMMQCLCQRFVRNDINYELWVAGDTDNFFFEELDRNYQLVLHRQQGEDLGERMAVALKKGLETYRQVIIIGSDCPFIDANYVSEAIQQLTHHDVVIGPANDGGYVLLGLKHFYPDLFVDITWGSGSVLNATLDKCKQADIETGLLAPLADIDRPEDLRLLDNQSLPIEIQAFSQYTP